MFYPKDFVEKAKELFPDYPQLYKALEDEDVAVGQYLQGSAHPSFSASEILKATSLEDLQAEATARIEKSDLYSEWCRLYRDQNPFFG